MKQTQDTWSRAHDMALIFIALAYGTDRDLSDEELSAITNVLKGWQEDFSIDQVHEVVLEAVAVYLEDEPHEEVLSSIHSLRDVLSPEDRRRALEDVMRIAESDGILLNKEHGLISILADLWEAKATGARLIDQTAVTVEDKPSWSLLHDIGLMFIVMAHSTDSTLSTAELTAMVDRLHDWQPELEEEEIREVLRECLSVYSEGPDKETLQQSVEALRRMLPTINRLFLLDDLAFIARADGTLNQHKRDLLETLSKAWSVGIRIENEETPDARA